jgi:hypothetical protein
MGMMPVTEVLQWQRRWRYQAMKAPANHYVGDPQGSDITGGPVNAKGLADIGGVVAVDTCLNCNTPIVE